MQAGENAGQGEVGNLMAKAAGQFVNEFAKSFGNQMGDDAASAVAAWY